MKEYERMPEVVTFTSRKYAKVIIDVLPVPLLKIITRKGSFGLIRFQTRRNFPKPSENLLL